MKNSIDAICSKPEQSTLKIDYLAGQEHFVLELAQLLYLQFGYLVPQRTLRDFEERMLAHCNRNRFPIAFIATEAGQLVGTFSLREHDMQTHQHLSPWIGSVFVHPSRRNEGIGTYLMRQAQILCRQLGIETLYLFTPDKQGWYLKLGWQRIEETTFNGHSVTIMKQDMGHLPNR